MTTGYTLPSYRAATLVWDESKWSVTLLWHDGELSTGHTRDFIDAASASRAWCQYGRVFEKDRNGWIITY